MIVNLPAGRLNQLPVLFADNSDKILDKIVSESLPERMERYTSLTKTMCLIRAR